ncbi:unnamed protein product, partial [Heterosigma akashiwo]
ALTRWRTAAALHGSSNRGLPWRCRHVCAHPKSGRCRSRVEQGPIVIGGSKMAALVGDRLVTGWMHPVQAKSADDEGKHYCGGGQRNNKKNSSSNSNNDFVY